MGLLHESRLDNAVDPGSIGVGERVDVRTRMGNTVSTGEVIATTPFGIVLRESGFFSSQFFLFAPIVEEPKREIENAIYDSPDDRVAVKFASMGETAPVFEADRLDDKGSKDSKKADTAASDDDEADDSDDDEDGEVDIPAASKPLAAPKSSIDVNKLPEDIRKSIISTTQMDGEQLNSVLSEIGDATVKALKRVSVKDTEVYGVVSKVQNAIHRILTGTPPAPPAPPKKAKKK